MNDQPIYLDNQATTPVDPRVLEAMLPYFTEDFGNPHSDSHPFGWKASNALEQSRALVASLIGADAREIIFASGATESCNIALRGIANSNPKGRRRIVTVATEHACVLETYLALQDEGFEVIVLPVQQDGLLNLNVVREAVDTQTLIVSVMLANNEIGVLQPVREIAKICREVGAYLHTDATQAVGKIPVDVQSLDVDFMSFSAHKFYGPKGIGALYVRWNNYDTLQPLTTGGGQERGMRPGTVAVPLAVGFGEASWIAERKLKRDMKHTGQLAKMLYEILRDRLPGIQRFLDIRFTDYLAILISDFQIFRGRQISGEEVIARIDEHLALSTGSACSSVSVKVSHVLKALGLAYRHAMPRAGCFPQRVLCLDDDVANSGVRISIGRFNREEEIQRAADILTEAVEW